METVTRKALGSGLRWGKLGTEDRPVSDWGGGGEDEPRVGNPGSDSATDCGLCATVASSRAVSWPWVKTASWA